MRKLVLPLVSMFILVLLSGCLDSDEEGGGSPIDEGSEPELMEQPVALDEGQTGTLSVPIVGINFIDTDVKHHWEMPSNVTGVRIIFTSTSSSWDLELSTGTGDCPHSGMMMNSTDGASSELSVEYWATGNESLAEGQWFCHVAVNDLSSHRGDSLDYVFEVILMSFEEIDCDGGVCPV